MTRTSQKQTLPGKQLNRMAMGFVSLLLIMAICLLPAHVSAGPDDRVNDSTILYKLKANASPAAMKRFDALVNASTVADIQEIKGVADVAKFRNIKGIEKAFSKQLMRTGAVEFAEPDAIIPHAYVPNDLRFDSQWHHATIHSALAWDYLQGPEDLNAVKVCVLDTGVDTDHPDLVDNLLLIGYSYQNRDTDPTNVEDVHGHGTSTAGVIGAVGNNGLGVAGVVWDIQIIPIQINISTTSSSAYISVMAEAIQWCADQGVKVVNLSYGGAESATIDSAAQYLRNRGGLLFMSAGNDGAYFGLSANPDYSSFVIVGATDQNDNRSGFSSWGPYVDVVAPGSAILTTARGGGFSSVYGTSFSSPMTAGLGALIFSVNPEFTPTEVENFISNTAVDLGIVGDDDMFGHGRIDAGAAVAAASDISPNEPPIAVAESDVTSGDAPLTVDFDGRGSIDPDGTIDLYVWNFGDGNTGSGVTPSHTYAVDGTFKATLTVTDDRGAQDTSDPITIVVNPDPTLVFPPTNLTAAVDANDVTLNWSHNLNNVTGFEIHRATKIRGKYDYSLVATTLPGNSYLDEGLELGTYKYLVRAIGTDGEYTDFSNEVSVKVEVTVTDPPDPGTLAAPVLSVASAGYLVTLNWTHDCPSVCTYVIARGDAKVRGQINFSEVGSVNGLLFQFEEGPGTYYYKVYAKAADQISADSNVVSVRLK